MLERNEIRSWRLSQTHLNQIVQGGNERLFSQIYQRGFNPAIIAEQSNLGGEELVHS
jgi:hypothetical protein